MERRATSAMVRLGLSFAVGRATRLGLYVNPLATAISGTRPTPKLGMAILLTLLAFATCFNYGSLST
jgi:hypothetical protein